MGNVGFKSPLPFSSFFDHDTSHSIPIHTAKKNRKIIQTTTTTIDYTIEEGWGITTLLVCTKPME